jgi:hypothetical protein
MMNNTGFRRQDSGFREILYLLDLDRGAAPCLLPPES